MRLISISDLKETFDRIKGTGSFSNWEKTAKIHLEAIEGKNKKERAAYWNKNNIWTELYAAFSELSGDKCWYTESKENSGEWQIDHFRPKGKSIDEEGKEILKEGYWWMSYDWRNFRLSGSLSNLLRKGRFEEGEETLGKGNYFPLKDKSKVAKEKDMKCRGEKPLLLDPINARDVNLLSFDKDGMPYETYNPDDNSLNHLRAALSIKCYGLKHKPLVRGRARVWNTCIEIVEDAQNDLFVYKDNDEKIDEIIEECFNKLANLANKKMPHSIVVFNYIKDKKSEESFEWLEDALIAIV
ncbi:HNH endonuclease family protein [Tenacibaculum maritimum]|uniref:hypothetical protein n=1 Tax=Tenacibaculum maritimum TaxID=107401 RepID=UPI0038761F29